MDGRHRPENILINVHIIVKGTMTHTGDVARGHFGVQIFGGVRNQARSLSDRLNKMSQSES